MKSLWISMGISVEDVGKSFVGMCRKKMISKLSNTYPMVIHIVIHIKQDLSSFLLY